MCVCVGRGGFGKKGLNLQKISCSVIISVLKQQQVKVLSLSSVWLFVTPWTVAHQAPLSIEFSRQDYQNGLPLPTLEDPPDLGTEPVSLASPALQEDSLSLVPPGKPNSISWAASNHKTCEALPTEAWMEFFTSFSASLHPTILPTHISRMSYIPGLYCCASHSNTS